MDQALFGVASLVGCRRGLTGRDFERMRSDDWEVGGELVPVRNLSRVGFWRTFDCGSEEIIVDDKIVEGVFEKRK